ncbi:MULTISPECIES: hypothetical protein [Bacillaceae]|uniref:hypothetical protein n=1 Tax=Bacillaceae TaxID=186817 RepID=UPI00214CB934|nr:hypothetical protein [Rossellomorea sp. YZS02]MDX8345298.1 hypothetical protein [Rossellomorea sp. YZS02]
MYPYRQQGTGGILIPIPLPGGGQGQYPGYPGQGYGGGINDRLDRLERQYERLDRKVDRLERKVERLERQLGYYNN